jgi:hypothetical protein
MQREPYSDDPFYSQPTERSRQAPQPQQEPPYYSPDPYAPNTVTPPPPYNQSSNYPEQRPSDPYRERQKASATKYGVGKLIDYLKWVLLVLEVLFTLRFLLKLLGADPSNPFASFLYGLSGFFLGPFSGLVHNPTFGATTYHVFEWTTLIGMLVYALFFWIIWLLLRITISRPQEPIT